MLPAAQKYLQVLLIVLIIFVSVTKQLENLTLTKAEKRKVDQFKDAISTLVFPRETMKEELNLVRYLRARRWDVTRANSMLMQTVKWWEDYKMNSIHDEDWSSFQKDYPIFINGTDKNGLPILALPLGDWDLRKAAVQGQIPNVIRWFIKNVDEVHTITRNLANGGKMNGTQWNLIGNLANFTRHQHMCVPCIRFHTEFATMYESHYPGGIGRLITLNTPSVFQVLLTLVGPVLSSTTRDAMQTLGTSKEEWAKVLRPNFEGNQLPESFRW
ncbi:SEC14 cytosolic factor [Folsomia candida]|uniref:SEC14 cytosolic factor n=1 Tax=Folsomia candida TaxID=158441 RepID=A0A226CZV8_FOLCA|nr:SEC14 cytosolic factor [Folsomia candida]OXA38855.1 SEC14 cytosolic factor [Folsomia candida]